MTPWTTTCQGSLSITNSQNLLKLTSIESVMPSNHLILCCPLLLLLSIFPRGQMEKAMAPHSSTLAWKIQWTEEPGRLQSMGSLRVRHDRETSLSIFTFMHWRRTWQPTPVFLPGESQGRGSLVGCHLWGRTESDMTKELSSSSSSRGQWL